MLKRKQTASSPVAQRVKDLALSLQWLGSLLWFGFDRWPWGIPHARSITQKKKQNKKKTKQFGFCTCLTNAAMQAGVGQALKGAG